MLNVSNILETKSYNACISRRTCGGPTFHLNATLPQWHELLMWWLHRHPERLESDLRAKIGQNGISSRVGRQDLKFLVCYLSEGRNLLLNTRNNSGDSPSLSAQVPRPYGTVQHGRETFPEWPTRGWLVCRSQAPHKLVVCHSGTRMSLGMDVSRSSVITSLS